ncbi:hypothetical protein, partial [Stenotrophomonas sp. MY18]
VFDSLQKLTARQVYVAGKEIARNGKMLTSLPDTPLTLPRDTVQLPAPGVDDFQMRIANAHHGVARLRHISGARFTRWGETEVQVRNGRVQIP